jgi:hypothetical protein
MGIKRVILSWDFIDWILAVLVVSMIIGGLAEGLDWMDRRSCRTGGGRVEKLDGDWRCVGGAP